MTDKSLDEIVAPILQKDFGYVKNDPREQWVVFKYRHLIVIHPKNRPRIYKKGCRGSYYEIEPI